METEVGSTRLATCPSYGRRWSRRRGRKGLAPLQRVSVAQYDQRQLDGTDAILEREALEGGFCDPLEAHTYLESVRAG